MSTTTRGIQAAARPVDAQPRVLRVLVVTQVLGGVGTATGLSVGALLVARLAGGPGLSGLAQSAVAVGGALLAIPVTRLMQERGRRPGLACGYLVGLLGGLIVITATVFGSVPLAIAGMFFFGGGITANLQARYAAVDLATPARRARHLSLVVWATTVGAVSGPNLAAPADRLVRPIGLPSLTGPYVFSAVAFVLAAGLLVVLLRPDPLLLARRLATEGPGFGSGGVVAPVDMVSRPAPESVGVAPGPVPVARGTVATGIAEMARNRSARVGLVAVAVGHAVMLAVMVMTPVHIDTLLSGGGGHGGHPDVLAVVGIVISLHVAGMYALSPLVGYASDRYGRRPVILAGALLLVVACGLAGTAGHDTVRLSAGLFLLGVGWSCTMVAGSTMLSESVPPEVRPSVQGFSDLIMGLAGAVAGAFSGLVLEWAGYPVLALAAALVTVPLMWSIVRTHPGRAQA
ncbi:MAG TPA: MFS transporter [Micromonosporaceae bacterium]